MITAGDGEARKTEINLDILSITVLNTKELFKHARNEAYIHNFSDI
jgi:hypothetical protein